MTEYQQRLQEARFNPSLMQEIVYDMVEAQFNKDGSFDIPSAGMPFPWLIENAVFLTSLSSSENEAVLRRVYAHLAQTDADLYNHMSDVDYHGRFSTPATTMMSVVMDRDEIIAKVVEVPDRREKRLTLPRYTAFNVGGLTYTMQYPVHIQLMSHGGLQLTYGNDRPSPISKLTTNMVDWKTIVVGGKQRVMMRIPVWQVNIETSTETINQLAGYKTKYAFNDRFYLARVYGRQSNGEWKEITTTHSQQVYDERSLTAVLRVEGSTLHVEIPPIYFSRRMVPTSVRVDIYTTQGEVDVDLGRYDPTAFEMILNDIDDDKRYTTPLKRFSQIQAFSQERVLGGHNGLSFIELRDQVIYNKAGGDNDPITENQLDSVLYRRGYGLVNTIDNVTDREYIATKILPTANLPLLSSPIGSMVGTFMDAMIDLRGSAFVNDNGLRVTILPTSLYEYQQGRVVRLPDHTVNAIIDMGPEARAAYINQRRYLFSPFHYVLDGTSDHFDVRPYQLTDPKVGDQVYVDGNDTVEIQIGIDQYDIEATDYGYRLLITTRGSDRLKEVNPDDFYAQLSYIPQGERTYASVNGTVVSNDEDVYLVEFRIETNFDITSDDYLRTLNFSMFDLLQRDFFTTLKGEFDITFILTNQDMRLYRTDDVDNLISRHLLPDTELMVVSRERLTLTLGTSLRSLWRRGRTVLGEESYRRYPANVPLTYAETILERDEDGELILGLADDGSVEYTVLHQKGDPVLKNGNPVYRHLKGDPVLEDGRPILIEPRRLTREYSMFLLDGLYYFASDQVVKDYVNSVGSYITSLLETDISELQSRMLERTKLYLHPTTTYGDTLVEANQDEVRSISLSQGMVVEYYLTDYAYRNIKLRETLTHRTHAIISDLLTRDTVSITDIVNALKEQGGDDITAINIPGFEGGTVPVLSVRDASMRLSLGTRAVVMPNMDITIQDDLDVMFYRHSGNRS